MCVEGLLFLCPCQSFFFSHSEGAEVCAQPQCEGLEEQKVMK